LWSRDSANAIAAMPYGGGVPERSWTGEADGYVSVVQQMHKALWSLNVGADFVLPETKDFSKYKLLIVPVLYIADDALLQRIHPAASRIEKLSQLTPSLFIVFDLLVDDEDESVFHLPLEDRRKRLEEFSRKYLKSNQTIRLSPVTADFAVARKWFQMGTALDGVIAKRRDLSYQSGERGGMQKIKRQRTADCVVGGFRYLEKQPVVGSLLLGLYNEEGFLDHVGFTSSIQAKERPALTRKLKPLIKPPGFTGKAPGGPSRWSTKRSTDWEPLEPKLVAEVQFDHFTGGRFRHGTKFLRWRPEKSPKACTMLQVQRENRSALDLL